MRLILNLRQKHIKQIKDKKKDDEKMATLVSVTILCRVVLMKSDIYQIRMRLVLNASFFWRHPRIKRIYGPKISEFLAKSIQQTFIFTK